MALVHTYSLELGSLFWKVLSNFCRNLAIGHLVNRFNTDDPPTKIIFLKTFLQLVLGLARTEYQNGICFTNARDYRIVVNVEMSRKLSLAAVFERNLLCFIWTLERRITRTAELSFNL
jgi:hypothetical protein